jgi:c-di-AMP phosphodiesterase-like protein
MGSRRAITGSHSVVSDYISMIRNHWRAVLAVVLIWVIFILLITADEKFELEMTKSHRSVLHDDHMHLPATAPTSN